MVGDLEERERQRLANGGSNGDGDESVEGTGSTRPYSNYIR